MNDLDRLLHDAASHPEGGRLRPAELLTAGRRKVRKRRFTAIAAATAAVAVVVGVTATMSTIGRDPDVVDRPLGPTEGYREVRITPAEVEVRCSAVLNMVHGTEATWVASRAPSGGPASAADTGQVIENREGFAVRLRPLDPRPGAERAATCHIPQADLIAGVDEAIAEPVPPADDRARVADLCSRRIG